MVADLLFEFGKESLKGQGWKTLGYSDGEGDTDDSPKGDRLPRDKGTVKKYESSKKISCFPCNGPHCVFECPEGDKLAAFVIDEERQKEISSITLLSVIQTKLEATQWLHVCRD